MLAAFTSTSAEASGSRISPSPISQHALTSAWENSTGPGGKSVPAGIRGCAAGLLVWQLLRVGFNQDDDLARGASLLDEPDSRCGIGERVGPVDHGTDAAGLDQVSDLLQGFGVDLGSE